MKKAPLFTVFALFSLLSMQVQASATSFDSWLNAFKQKAMREGISERTLDAAFTGVVPNERVVELDRKQPERKWTFAEYKQRVVTADRIQKGRRLIRQHRAVLEQVEQTYGVPKEVIVSLWAIESNFGQNTGGFDVIRSLATLAWDGRREKLFTGELIAALQIIEQGHVTRTNMKGSWAGAMGQSQFMPTSFLRLAADGNGDGRKDIWGTEADVFASAANYLARSGWESGERWGRRVKLPNGFFASLIDRDIKKPISEWARLGVTRPNGETLPNVEGMKASIVAPDGPGGEVFIVYQNYDVFMSWNRSTYFATSVGLLADALRV